MTMMQLQTCGLNILADSSISQALDYRLRHCFPPEHFTPKRNEKLLNFDLQRERASEQKGEGGLARQFTSRAD